MAKLLLPALGLGIGSAFGSPLMGLSAGEMASGLLFPENTGAGRLSDLRVQGSSYGTPIPRVYGAIRIAGNIIWCPGLLEHKKDSGSSSGGVGNPNYTYSVNIAVMVCAGPVVVNRIWADTNLIYNLNSGSPIYATGLSATNLRIYPGNETQMPDSLIQATVGVGVTPAYRGRCYVVLEGLLLGAVGNRIPNFTFEVVQATNPTLSSVIQDVLQYSSKNADTPDTPTLGGGDFNLTATNGITVAGFAIASRQPAKNIVEQLQTVYHFDLVEIDGKITTVLRGSPTTVYVSDQDLGAGGDSGSPAPRIRVVRAQDVDMPRRVDVLYFAQGFNYQTGMQSAQRETRYASAPQTLSFPVVLDDNTAKGVAYVSLHEQWMKRVNYQVTLPWRYLYASPGDVLNVPGVAGETRLMRIAQSDAAAPGVIQFSGGEYDSDVYNQTSTGGIISAATATVLFQAGTIFVVADLPAVRPQDTLSPGVYVGGCGDGLGGQWHGATVHLDLGLGSGYQPLVHLDDPATIGVTTTGTSLPVFTGTPGTEDVVSVIVIQLVAGSAQDIVSAPSYSALNYFGVNLCMVGAEIIQFHNASIVGHVGLSTTVQLTGLKRGIKGTPTAGHITGVDKFMVLNDAVKRINLDPSAMGIAGGFRGVTDGVNVTDATGADQNQSYTVVGNSYVTPAVDTNLIHKTLNETKTGQLALTAPDVSTPPLKISAPSGVTPMAADYVEIYDNTGALVARIHQDGTAFFQKVGAGGFPIYPLEVVAGGAGPQGQMALMVNPDFIPGSTGGGLAIESSALSGTVDMWLQAFNDGLVSVFGKLMLNPEGGSVQVGPDPLITQDIDLNGVSYEGTPNVYRIGRNLGNYSNSLVTGAIVIETTIPEASFSVMASIHIEGYCYDATAAFDITIAGYFNASGSFLNCGYVNTGSLKPSVQFGKRTSNGMIVIVLGMVGTVWNYPKLWVSQMKVGFNTSSDAWFQGWTFSLQTSLAFISLLTTVPDTTAIPVSQIVSLAANESTGAGAALLGTNSPAVTNAAPYKWIKLITSDGSTVYIPAWK